MVKIKQSFDGFLEKLEIHVLGPFIREKIRRVLHKTRLK